MFNERGLRLHIENGEGGTSERNIGRFPRDHSATRVLLVIPGLVRGEKSLFPPLPLCSCWKVYRQAHERLSKTLGDSLENLFMSKRFRKFQRFLLKLGIQWSFAKY